MDMMMMMRVHAIGWDWRSKYKTSSYSSNFEFIFCFKCILVLLARHSSGELRCSATALIHFVHDSFLCSIRKYGMCMCKDMDHMLIMVCLVGHSF